MILKRAKIYSNGSIYRGALLINNGIIHSIKFNPNDLDLYYLCQRNKDSNEIDCQNKLILPGIIDIHSHLRDLGQMEKETFNTATLAAAFSGITTAFNMPNTQPPAITANQIKVWMKKAGNNIFIDVGFISGVPKEIDIDEIKKVIELGVIGFKIYPHNPLSNIDWNNNINLQKILTISSNYQKPIFIHPEWPLTNEKRKEIYEKCQSKGYNILKLHNKIKSSELEEKYVRFVIDNYNQFITKNKLKRISYPIIHFCHISCKESYTTIQNSIIPDKNLKISFEVTPHHIFLSDKINLTNPNYGKVDPPLRNPEDREFLFNRFKEGSIKLIGSDHAPHLISEKIKDYLNAPSGFPGFETYPLLFLDKVFHNELSLKLFIKAASENPAINFNLKNKGFIREGFDADLIIVDKITKYPIISQNFKTKAKFTPYENFKTSVQIWKVLLRGNEINIENSSPKGKIIRL